MDRKRPPEEVGEKGGQRKEGGQEEKASQSSSDDDSQGESQEGSRKSGGDYSNLERLRKQKRLAMNRESARNRRKFKKEKLETLESQVARLSEENQGLRTTVKTLSTKITQLESELSIERSTIAALRLQGSDNTNLPASSSTTLPGAGNSATSLQMNAASRALPNASTGGITLPSAPDVSASQLFSAHARLQNVSRPGIPPSATGAASAYSLLSNTNQPSIEALSALLGPGNRMSSGTADLVAHLQQGFGGRQSGVPRSLHQYAASLPHRSSLTSEQSENQGILAESLLASGRPTGIAGSLLNEGNIGQGNQQANLGVDNIVRMLRQDQTRGDVFLGDLRRFVSGAQPATGTQNSEGQAELGNEVSAELLARFRRGDGPSDASGANSSRRPGGVDS